jgi:hypothetical protein
MVKVASCLLFQPLSMDLQQPAIYLGDSMLLLAVNI